MVVVRHGESRSNAEGALESTCPGSSITPRGRRQAEEIAALFASNPFHAVFSSPARRCIESADILAKSQGLVATILPGLSEVKAGVLEGCREVEAIREYSQVLERWEAGDLDISIAGGESGLSFWRRFTAALEGIWIDCPPGRSAAVVTHGAAMRVFKSLGVTPVQKEPVDGLFGNTGYMVIERQEGGKWLCSRLVPFV